MLVAETTVRMPAFAIAALPMQAWPAPAPATEGDGRRRSRVSRKAHDCLVANRVAPHSAAEARKRSTEQALGERLDVRQATRRPPAPHRAQIGGRSARARLRLRCLRVEFCDRGQGALGWLAEVLAHGDAVAWGGARDSVEHWPVDALGGRRVREGRCGLHRPGRAGPVLDQGGLGIAIGQG